jgi:hypothetical protein
MKLRRMRRTAFLINVARGAVIAPDRNPVKNGSSPERFLIF